VPASSQQPAASSQQPKILRLQMFKSRSFRLARPSCRCRLALCIALALGQYSAFAADITAPPTEPVKGRAPTASTPVFVNKSASGKNPAIDDQIEASYAFTDVDGDAEDSNNGVLQWKADASNIANATTKTFVPTAAQLKKFLTFDATPGTNPLITDPDRAVSTVTSLPSGGPVLPSRAQLASEFINAPAPNSMRWGDAYMYCANKGERLPAVAELQTLFTTYTRANAVGEESRGDIVNTYGWDGGVRWANTGSDASHDYVYIHTNGQRNSNANSSNQPVACITAGAGEGLPTVTAISIPNATVSTPVKVEYTFVSNATIPSDRSRFQWYTATSASGAGKVIATGNGATTHTYTPVNADGGKFLMVEITPASYDTVVGPTITGASMSAVSQLELPMPAGTILAVNGHNFSIESGFPATGFTGAEFQVMMSGSAVNNSNYTYSVDQSWLSVDSAGKVKFTSEPTSSSKTFKLIAKDKNTQSQYTKKFTISSLFTNNGSTVMNWQGAANYCSSRGGQPLRQHLTNADRNGVAGTRGTGSLWGEWGNMGSYPSAGFIVSGSSHWTSEAIDSSNHWGVYLKDSQWANVSNNITVYVVCRRAL
jgi:hypothetical protein